MQKEPQTCVSEMKMIHRMPIVSNAVEPVPEIQWRTRSKPAWCEHLLKNLSVAAACFRPELLLPGSPGQ